MTRELHTSIEIDAPAEAVWAVLTDFESYPEWNPFIRRVDGELRPDARLEVEIEPPGGSKLSFNPKLLEVRPERELRWLGRFLLPGLFDGEHSLRIEPLDDGRSRFVQSESLSGLLVRPFGSTLDKTKAGFEQMNAALKARVESTTTNQEAGMTSKLQDLISRLVPGARADEPHVHFHQGPQGQPAPCFDDRCPTPRLSL